MISTLQPTLLIHGGAGSKVSETGNYSVIKASLEKVLDAVWPQLMSGSSALDAVIAAVEALEDDPLYNAGKGSKIQADGKIRMSASLCDGSRRRFSGCVNVQRVKNPIRLAERLLERDDRVLAGAGAERYARDSGLPFASPYTTARKQEWRARLEGRTGTVGAVAVDVQGRMAAATSTGGRGMEFPHRVSDTPTTAGNFANRVCAVSMTGVGERIVEFAAASTICAQVDAGVPLKKAVDDLMSEAQQSGAEFGLISVDAQGEIAIDTTTPCLVWAAAAPGSDFRFFTAAPHRRGCLL